MIHCSPYSMAAANLYEPPPPSYQAAQGTTNYFAGKNQTQYLPWVLLPLIRNEHVRFTGTSAV